MFNHMTEKEKRSIDRCLIAFVIVILTGVIVLYYRDKEYRALTKIIKKQPTSRMIIDQDPEKTKISDER